MENGQWNIERFIQQAPSADIHNILATQFALQHGTRDTLFWTLNTDRNALTHSHG